MPVNMLPHILSYFRAEKQACLYVIIIGMLAVVVGIWLWRRSERWRGAAIPLIVVAVIQFAVGGTTYFHTDAQIDSLTGLYYSNPAQYKLDETARMTRVVSNFIIYEAIEGLLFTLGVAACLAGRSRPMLRSAGAALALQASVMMVLDRMASQRADLYLDAIRHMK